jgi:hypothetical protein
MPGQISAERSARDVGAWRRFSQDPAQTQVRELGALGQIPAEQSAC